MYPALRPLAALRAVLAERRDLLLEIVALNHQLVVLRRSNRRLRTADRLLWCALRRWWRPWKEGLVLAQPATVARWQREGLWYRWWHRSGRWPGRPRIDADVQALIRRLATENRLWGAPRVHGELLKLGIAVSERTVSRYLADTRRAPSQTWRTFLANHVGQLTVTVPLHLFGNPIEDDDIVGAGDGPPGPVSVSVHRPFVLGQRSLAQWPTPPSLHALESRVRLLHVHRLQREHVNAGRAPPERRRLPSTYTLAPLHGRRPGRRFGVPKMAPDWLSPVRCTLVHAGTGLRAHPPPGRDAGAATRRVRNVTQ